MKQAAFYCNILLRYYLQSFGGLYYSTIFPIHIELSLLLCVIQSAKEKTNQHSHHPLNFVEYSFTPLVLLNDDLDAPRYCRNSC